MEQYHHSDPSRDPLAHPRLTADANLLEEQQRFLAGEERPAARLIPNTATSILPTRHLREQASVATVAECHTEALENTSQLPNTENVTHHGDMPNIRQLSIPAKEMLRQISEENDKQIASMTNEEILAAQAEIRAALPDAVLASILARMTSSHK